MKTRKSQNILFISLSVVILLVLISLTSYFLGFDSYIVNGSSMQPTIVGEIKDGKKIVQKGDKIYIRKTKKLKRGDICVFSENDTSNGKFLVKRVIGVAGDEIEIKDGRVFLNGKKLHEPYLADSVQTFPEGISKFSVKKGEVFCLGDNRGNSHDSRYFGCIKEKDLVGKCISVYRNNKKIKVL